MIIDTYSKRKKRENGELSDIFNYDIIPNKLRIQISQIWDDAIGKQFEVWNLLSKVMRKELGVKELVAFSASPINECKDFLFEHQDTDEVLDIIELSFRIINTLVRSDNSDGQRYGRCQRPDEAIEELNQRFKESSLGYEFVENKIIRVDRKFIHNEITKPAIKLLYEEEFEGVSDEFFKAYENYKDKKYKDAILYAGKAFESVMKTICENKGYEYNKERDTANKLIQLLCNKDFIPMELKTHMQSLEKVLLSVKTTLESGLPTLRNRKGGHGQGNEVVYVPEQFVTYALNLAATNIVLLVDLYKENK